MFPVRGHHVHGGTYLPSPLAYQKNTPAPVRERDSRHDISVGQDLTCGGTIGFSNTVNTSVPLRYKQQITYIHVGKPI
jgi:hypothetical protein